MSEAYSKREPLSTARYVLEETLRLSEAHGIGHNEVISVTQLTNLLVTKSLDVEPVEGEPKFPLCELVANEVAAYRRRTGKEAPASLLRAYGWDLSELDAMAGVYFEQPILRIVPQKAPKPAKPVKKAGSLPDPEKGVANYLREIHAPGFPKYHKMGPEEQERLVSEMLKGFPEAVRMMVKSNLGLAVSIAKKYIDRGASLIELITFANEGLYKAATPKYDPSRAKFSTYASWWIKQSIRRNLVNEVRAVRVPAYMVEALVKYKNFREEFFNQTGMFPEAEDVAKELGFSMKKARLAIMATAQSEWAINIPHWRDEPEFIDDMAESTGPLGIEEYSSYQGVVKAMKTVLSERERLIIELRYGLDGLEQHTLEDIGNRIKLTRERIRQIHDIAVLKIKRALGVITDTEYAKLTAPRPKKKKEE